MTKDIWHTEDEKPVSGLGMIVYYSKEYDEELLVGYYNTEYEEFRPLDEYYCEEKTVKKWCYVDDLLACEQELNRTRKALDYATEMLERIAVSPETMLEPEKIVPQLAGQALEQIESITKAKEQQ